MCPSATAAALACGSGCMYLRQENEGIKLWIPDNSTSRMNMEWLWDNFPNDLRFHTMIFEADNVLEPRVIRAMYSARKRIAEAVTESGGDTWEDMCQGPHSMENVSFQCPLFEARNLNSKLW